MCYIMPFTRGGVVCRWIRAVLEEVHAVVDQGAREVLLLGQYVNAWRPCQVEGAQLLFSDLLPAVLEVPGLLRLRFLISHPIALSDEVIERYRDKPNLASPLYLPIQSGSDTILSLRNIG